MITAQSIKVFFEQNDCTLKPSQKRICLPIINRMTRKMRAGIRFPDITVHAEIIVNGHHRYIASLFAGIEIGQSDGGKPNSDITTWESIEIVEEDRDTSAKRMLLNQRDADFNELSLETVVAIAG